MMAVSCFDLPDVVSCIIDNSKAKACPELKRGLLRWFLHTKFVQQFCSEKVCYIEILVDFMITNPLMKSPWTISLMN